MASLPHRTWRWLIGRPLSPAQARKEEIGPIEGLSALSLDALTSVAYGPQAMVVVLAAAGLGALRLTLPITAAVVVLLAILVFSYRQVIEAYPRGGGAYAVSRENLGAGVSQVAAAALIVDYVLTVSVSIAAGVGALTSAFPPLLPFTVPICLALLAVITVLNLRGLGSSARAFLVPTLLFIAGILAVVVVGLIHPFAAGAAQPGHSTLPARPLEVVGLLLVLKAFASGCSALTEVEAIANGVPQFRRPRVARAKQTELLLGVLLGVMLLGLATLIVRFHIGPRTGQTVLSQVTAASLGRNWAYYIVSITTTLVLGLAANTSFGGLPILGSLLARDNYLPHLFAIRDDRLVYSIGVWTLAIASGALLAVVGGNTDRLIPLFAIGVFTSFTLSQAGMVLHWWRIRPPGWRGRAGLNGLGAVMTAIATLIFLLTKFTAGGWVVVVAVPALIFLFRRVSTYYRRVAVTIGLSVVPKLPAKRRVLAIVPITNVSKVTAAALADALSIGDEVVAVHVQFTDDEKSALVAEWARWNPGVPLVTLRSPYHSVVRPILRYVRSTEARRGGHDLVVVLIPVVVPRRLRHRILHNQMDLVLDAVLHRRKDVVVARIPYRLED